MFEALFRYPRSAFERGTLVYTAAWPDWLVPLLAVTGAIAIVALLALRRQRMAPWQLASIGFAQAALLALLLWIVRLPALETEKLREGENVVALLLDTSASMELGAGSSRADDARYDLEAVIGGDDLAVRVRRYEFDGALRPVDAWTDATPSGTQTAIAAAVARVLDESRFDPLAAVIVASDGADTAGGITESELAAISAYGIPVHTIGVGRESMPEDLELADVLLPDRALPGSTVSARVQITHDTGGTARLRVHAGERLLAAQNVDLSAEGGATIAWLDIELFDRGPQALEFTLEPLAGEQELRNNQRSALVDVLDEDYRVLYFEGEPRWEYKFLRRALDGDEGLQVVSLLRVSPNKYYRQGIDTPEQLADGFPSERETLFSYDALIIGSVEAALLSAEQQRMVADFVAERGGSLLLTGGLHGLGNGGWGQSLLADALPARLPPLENATFFRRRATVRPTPQGLANRMLRLADAEADNAEAWRRLPEIADYQLIGNLKPAATTLLVADTGTDELPLLVGQPYGRGHSYVLATGGTWRWQMSLPAEDLSHETFWRQLLRGMVASSPRPSRLTTGRVPGGGIELRAEFRDSSFVPLADITVEAVVSREDGASWNVRLTPSGTESGVYTAQFDPGESGIYFAEAVAARDDTAIASARSSLRVEAGQAEHFGIRRNSATLQRLAEATGGRYLADAAPGQLADAIRYSGTGITDLEYRPVWNLPAVFLLLIMIKLGEWLMRRRWSTI